MASITLSQAIQGFDLAMHARGLSENTIIDYKRTLNLLMSHLAENPLVSQITKAEVESFLSMHSRRLSNKSLRNYHIGLSAFWTWCVTEKYARFQIVRNIPKPRPEVRSIEPFSGNEIRLLLGAARKSKAYRGGGFVNGLVEMSLPHADRNTAIILLLLDTGIRATELCNAKIGSLDLRAGHITVMGKGNKERRVPFSTRTGKAIWKYFTHRENPIREEPLFLSSTGRPLNRNELANTLRALGRRVGLEETNPHRFRHTFAILYLRNGGDVFTLQKILGHSSMEMVRRYLALAQVDMENAHRRASPVENLKL